MYYCPFMVVLKKKKQRLGIIGLIALNHLVWHSSFSVVTAMCALERNDAECQLREPCRAKTRSPFPGSGLWMSQTERKMKAETDFALAGAELWRSEYIDQYAYTCLFAYMPGNREGSGISLSCLFSGKRGGRRGRGPQLFSGQRGSSTAKIKKKKN